MTANSYLTGIASQAILRDEEKASVHRSITTLQTRLANYFGDQIGQHFVFGSFSRGTILPRSMDPQSDVDYMVVFADVGLQPQAYLDRLRRFAEAQYVRSEVMQSHPTVVLELNHMRFELVPAVRNWLNCLQIPRKGYGFQKWQDTDPNGFNQTLSNANQVYGNLIKPLVRVMKYWNATANYPFESYALEQHLVGQAYGFLGLVASRQLADYFFQAARSLEAGWSAPQWKQDAVNRLKHLASTAQSQERFGGSVEAEATLMRILPPVRDLLRA
ncbi:MAG: nucleotidyltransferase domain-containing protein [Acidobacteria bacterium]|nr:nucleotidyltransferase domain-containing protein [Acidobacteriota bacterium]